jgi:hypothetical protein
MNKTLFVLALTFVTTTAFADVYKCTVTKNSNSDFGDHFSAVVSSRAIKLVGTTQGPVAGKIDAGYTPRAKNAGSIRYFVSVNNNSGSGCGDAQVILNKAMAAGKDGLLTIAYDCDSDGSGPAFETFSCQK